MQTEKEQSEQVKPINAEQERLYKLSYVRVYLLDELVSHNGKQLDVTMIGEITNNVLEKLEEVL